MWSAGSSTNATRSYHRSEGVSWENEAASVWGREMSQPPQLPGMPEEQEAQQKPPVGAHRQRIARAVRDQIELVPQSLEDRVAMDHPARAIWVLLERLELGAFYTRIRAAVDGPGRP